MSQDRQSEMERCNRTAIIGHTAASIVYTMVAFMEVGYKYKSIIYAIIIAIIAFAPIAMEAVTWKKNHDSNIIMHLVGIGFSILYTVVAFTTSFSCTYIFFLPMFMVVSVYGDLAFLLKENAGVIIINSVTVIGGAITGRFGFVNISTGIIQLTTVVIAAVASYFVTRTLSLNNTEKIAEVSESQTKTELLLNRMSKVTAEVREGINIIHDKTSMLNENAERSTDSMVEVTVGASDTADALQDQLEHSQQISERIDTINTASQTIKNHMSHTLEVLENGKNDITILVNEVNTSVEKGADVADKLETLDKYIDKMHSIVELINGITSQTSLLALNASIEAARAGEAGRGFAVVASEITAMANQTQGATIDITNLINNVSASINEVVAVVRDMIVGINEEKKSTESASLSFGNIEQNTLEIRDNIFALSNDIDKLQEANRLIAESIQTVSAISQEVSAHANETLETEKANKHNIDEIARRVQELTFVIQD